MELYHLAEHRLDTGWIQAGYRLHTKMNQTPAGKASAVCAHVAEPFQMAFLNLAQDDLVQNSLHVIVLILHCHFDTIRRMDKP